MARRHASRLFLSLVSVVAIVVLVMGLLVHRVTDVYAASSFEGAPPPGLEALARNLYLGLATAAAIASAAAWFAARRLSRPLRDLKSMTHRMASGDYELDIPALADDDLESIRGSLHAIARDLRTRIATAARGRKSLEAILQSMVEGLVAVDDESRLVLMNDVAAQLLGVDAGSVEGRPLSDVTRSQVLLDGVRDAVETGRSLTRQIAGEDGIKGRIVEVHISPLRDEAKDIGGAVAVLHDVTTMRRLETMRRDFVANVSHELKTPLTVIQGSADTILDDARMPADVLNRFVSKIRDNAHRLNVLINDILELSRIQSGTDFLDREAFDLRGLVRETITHLADAAAGKSIELRLDFADAPVRVVGDRRALTSVVENLLSNAIDYTPEGGRVEVAVRAEGEHAVLRVADTGIGIDKEKLDRIFERFYRVDPGRSRAIGGTGLGLAIVKNCVQAHDGVIDVVSELGAGTTFTVRLPRPRVQEPAAG